MREETLFKSETPMDRNGVASYLRTMADRLESGESITLESGEDELTLDIPDTLEFEVEVEREGRQNAPGELSLELELEWDEDGGDGELRIQ